MLRLTGDLTNECIRKLPRNEQKTDPIAHAMPSLERKDLMHLRNDIHWMQKRDIRFFSVTSADLYSVMENVIFFQTQFRKKPNFSKSVVAYFPQIMSTKIEKMS